MAESNDPGVTGASRSGSGSGSDTETMLPHRPARRSRVESVFVRVVATCGIVGICVAIAAIMGSSGSQHWLIGLVVSIVSVVLAAVLWSTRHL
jgi:hypothetical protein